MSMKACLRFVSFVFLLIAFLFQMVSPVSAIVNPLKSPPVTVTASVGEFHLNISGYASPYASVVLTINGVFIRATVADSHGNFVFSDILIKRGLSGFCLTHVDYKRLGDSEACFTFPPADKDITMKEIFLPPTLGLQRTEIVAGGEAVAFGYTMPGARVTLHLSDGRTFQTTADSTGYYEFHIKNMPSGTYKIYADATFHGKPSAGTSRVLELKAMSLWEQLISLLNRFWKWLIGLLLDTPLGLLWLVIPVLILIIILIHKLWPDKFTSLYGNRIYIFFARRSKKKLHHWWFVGF